jgi:hypothetical protein
MSLANEIVDELNRVLQGRLGLLSSATAGKFALIIVDFVDLIIFI